MEDLKKVQEFFSKPLPEQSKEDPTDLIAMDVPLFIRMLEWAREDAETDMELHNAAERAIEAVKLRGLLSMDDYRDIVGVSKDELKEGIISLTPEEEKIARDLVPTFIEGIRNREIDVPLTSPIKYKMASGEEASFTPFIYSNADNSLAGFFKQNENDLNDNYLGINYNYYGPAYDAYLVNVWKDLTGDNPDEDLLTSIRHELIHAKDPAVNHKPLKAKYDSSDPTVYYGGWREFPAQTGEFLEVIKNRTEVDIQKGEKNGNLANWANNLSFYFQDILDFYSGKDKFFDEATVKWFSGPDTRSDFQRFIKNIANWGGNFLGFYISPNWSQMDILERFVAKIDEIKKYNPEGYKEFQKDLYVLIQKLVDQINSKLPKDQQIQAGGTGKFKDLDEIRLVPKDQLEALATKLAAQVFSKKQNLKPAIDILKKALEDSYKALDPEVKIKEETGYSKYLATPENPQGKTPGLTPDIMNKILMKIATMGDDDVEETTRLGEGVIYEELCPKGKAYIKKRQAAGEKSSAYLSGRAVKVCKGQMEG